MSIAEKKQKTLLKRRKRAIVLSAVAVLLLALALVFVLDYVSTITFTDPADGRDYFIRKKDGVYGLYDDRTLLPVNEDLSNSAQTVTCYVTKAGTLVKINYETGESEVHSILETEGTEVQGTNYRIQIFPHVQKKNILSIEVHNDTGSYTFARYDPVAGRVDKNAEFVIRSSPLTTYDQELFGNLYFTAGYTLSTEKLKNPIVDENGEFSEYGLVPETRYRTVDEEGEPLETPEAYEYVPAYYILTDVEGNRHKLIIGDALVTGEGYYVQYVALAEDNTETKRSAVYVLDNTVGSTLLAPIEDYVTPLLSYPMKSNNYTDVEDFVISLRKDDAVPGGKENYENVISFSYVDISLRQNTIAASFPYVLDMELNGYLAASGKIDQCLRSLYEPSIKQVCILTPTDEELCEYGLYAKVENEDGSVSYTPYSPYILNFKYDITNDSNEYMSTIHQVVMISGPNEDGNYYAFTQVNSVKIEDGEEKITPSYTYDMIVEVEPHTLSFLHWDRAEWVDKGYIQTNIAFVTQIKLESPNYSAVFNLDNSATTAGGTLSTFLSVAGSDSLGNEVDSIGKMILTDVDGLIWEISARDVQVFNSAGKEGDISLSAKYYAYNAIGEQVLCLREVISCADYDVEVTADAVKILYKGSTTVKESFVRYETSLFRLYYSTFNYATIMDSYPLTEEEEAALLNDPEKHLLTLTITTKDTDGTEETKVYRFYQVAARKAYITINGNGGFYVLKSRVDKFVTDAQRFFNLEMIDPTATH